MLFNNNNDRHENGPSSIFIFSGALRGNYPIWLARCRNRVDPQKNNRKDEEVRKVFWGGFPQPKAWLVRSGERICWPVSEQALRLYFQAMLGAETAIQGNWIVPAGAESRPPVRQNYGADARRKTNRTTLFVISRDLWYWNRYTAFLHFEPDFTESVEKYRVGYSDSSWPGCKFESTAVSAKQRWIYFSNDLEKDPSHYPPEAIEMVMYRSPYGWWRSLVYSMFEEVVGDRHGDGVFAEGVVATLVKDTKEGGRAGGHRPRVGPRAQCDGDCELTESGLRDSSQRMGWSRELRIIISGMATRPPAARSTDEDLELRMDEREPNHAWPLNFCQFAHGQVHGVDIVAIDGAQRRLDGPGFLVILAGRGLSEKRLRNSLHYALATAPATNYPILESGDIDAMLADGTQSGPVIRDFKFFQSTNKSCVASSCPYSCSHPTIIFVCPAARKAREVIQIVCELSRTRSGLCDPKTPRANKSGFLAIASVEGRQVTNVVEPARSAGM
ncbi:hypothetical protein C8F01DRAFT_1225217 [Mycena amicta]|nr:hypothetical protein C8F01DRAFT_1225217 [Mycena amicta]